MTAPTEDGETPAMATVPPPADAPKPRRKPGRPELNPPKEQPVKKAAKKRAPKKRPLNPKPYAQTRAGYKYDWPDLQIKFVEGILPEDAEPTSESRTFPNLKELAERESVPYDIVRARAADERWYDMRQDYQLRLSKARQSKRIAELSKQSIEFDEKSLQAAKLGQGLVLTRLAEIGREVQAAQIRRQEAEKLQASGFEVDPREFGTAIDAKELSILGQAAASWQIIGQKSLGTDITRMEIQHDIQASIDVDMTTTSIAAELGRDDPDRLAAFLQAAKRSGLLDVVMEMDNLAIEAGTEDAEGIIEAEIVEDTA